MFPTITVFGRTIGTYTLLALLGALLAGALACFLARKRRLDDNRLLVMLLWAALGALLGGHLLYALTELRLLPLLGQAATWEERWQVLFNLFGGAVFYGGLLGALLAAFLYGRRRRLDMAAYADCAAPVIPLFHACGRVGCFLGGCCYGIENDWGITYTHALVESANGVRRFPVQLLEAGVNLLLCGLLLWWFWRGKAKGKLLPAYLLLYAPCRFLLEFLRGDAYRGFFGPLSTSQWVSLLLVVSVGVWRACIAFRRAKGGPSVKSGS